MNKLTKEMNKGFQEIIAEELELPEHTSKADRVLQCRDCNSIEIHNPKFFSLHGETCKKGCGFGFSSEDLVPLPIKCKNCGNQKGFDFPDDSGVEEAELANHEMYAKAKASMIGEQVEELDELESEFAEATQLAENSPRVKGTVEKQVFTIEPQDGFDSSGFVEKDLYHKANIHETIYGMFVNPGNTPHMQKIIPMSEIVSFRKGRAQATYNAFFETKTYGDREINAECKAKMGFSIECNNEGNRRLSDQFVKRTLTSIYFAENKVKEIELIQLERKLTKDEVSELDKSQETSIRLTGVLKTGNASCGHQSPVYESRDNTYDPVSLEKLQMELDIPWTEKVMDIHKIAQRVHKNKTRAKKAAKTRAANKLKKAESQ